MQQLKTVQDVAEFCKVTVPTVRRWAKSGELRAVNMARHARNKYQRFRFTDEAIAEFVAVRGLVSDYKPAKPTHVRPDNFKEWI